MRCTKKQPENEKTTKKTQNNSRMEPQGQSGRPKVLITGATGLLGRSVVSSFQSSGVWDVIGVGGLSPSHGGLKVDLRDENHVKSLVHGLKPDVIVHCAAERRVDRVRADPEGTRKLNVLCTQWLAQLCKQLGAWLLFISSDYVFDGTAPPYTSRSPTNPLNEYGVQKRDAELLAREADWGCGVLRVPLLYGAVASSLDETQVSALLAQLLLQPGSTIVADNVQIRYPTLVDDVAAVIVQLAQRKMEHCGLSGIWHFSGPDPMTKFQMAQRVAHLFGLSGSCSIVEADPAAVPTDRPHDAHLDGSTLQLMGIGDPATPFDVGVVRALGKWVKGHHGDGGDVEATK